MIPCQLLCISSKFVFLYEPTTSIASIAVDRNNPHINALVSNAAIPNICESSVRSNFFRRFFWWLSQGVDSVRFARCESPSLTCSFGCLHLAPVSWRLLSSKVHPSSPASKCGHVEWVGVSRACEVTLFGNSPQPSTKVRIAVGTSRAKERSKEGALWGNGRGVLSSKDDCARNMICACGDDFFCERTPKRCVPGPWVTHENIFACVKCARCGVEFTPPRRLQGNRCWLQGNTLKWRENCINSRSKPFPVWGRPPGAWSPPCGRRGSLFWRWQKPRLEGLERSTSWPVSRLISRIFCTASEQSDLDFIGPTSPWVFKPRFQSSPSGDVRMVCACNSVKKFAKFFIPSFFSSAHFCKSRTVGKAEGLKRSYSCSFSSSIVLLDGTLVVVRINRDEHHGVYPFWSLDHEIRDVHASNLSPFNFRLDSVWTKPVPQGISFNFRWSIGNTVVDDENKKWYELSLLFCRKGFPSSEEHFFAVNVCEERSWPDSQTASPAAEWHRVGALLIPVSNSEVGVAGGGVEQDDGNVSGTCRRSRSVERGLNMSDFTASAQRQHVPSSSEPFGSPEPWSPWALSRCTCGERWQGTNKIRTLRRLTRLRKMCVRRGVLSTFPSLTRESLFPVSKNL